MGNNTVCKIVGIDNIPMRIFYGQVRTLTNVRHIPDLRKNLLSLEAQGCKFSGADGGIKVTKGSTMILKGECTINLYKMIGSSIISDTSVAIEKEDATKLWHMRLGHMIERDKKGALLSIKY